VDDHQRKAIEPMPTKSAPHPGLALKRDIEAQGLSNARAAQALGVSRSQLHRVTSGDCAISPDLALRLEFVFGSTAAHWLRLQADHDAARVRRRAKEITRGLERFVPAHKAPA
jgi:addiction module HigA family antidote